MLGLKGGNPQSLDEIVVPVIVEGNVDDSPFQPSINVGRNANVGAVAVNNNAAIVRAGAGTILRIDGFQIVNETAATASYTFTIMTPANIVTGTLIGTASPLVALSDPIDPLGAVNRVGSTIQGFNHTSILGTAFWRPLLADDEERIVTFQQPIYLDGNARGGIGALACWHAAQNVAGRFAVIGREYLHRA